MSWQYAINRAVFGATALISFVYIGSEDIINLSEKSVEPKKNVPRALITAVIVTSVLYLLVVLATIHLVPPETLAGRALAVSALFATASTALISLISISRLLFGMAREGDMPKVLARLLPRRKTPWVAALVLFALACSLLPLGRVEIIASISSFGILLVFITVQAAVIRLRFTKPGMTRGFRVPLALGRWPVLPTMGIAMCAALLTRFDPLVYAIGGGALVLGSSLYFLQSRWQRKTRLPARGGGVA